MGRQMTWPKGYESELYAAIATGEVGIFYGDKWVEIKASHVVPAASKETKHHPSTTTSHLRHHTINTQHTLPHDHHIATRQAQAQDSQTSSIFLFLLT